MQTFRILLEQVICLIEFVIEDAAGMESDGMAPFDIRCALLLLSWIVHFFFFDDGNRFCFLDLPWKPYFFKNVVFGMASKHLHS